jgi:hypothetical protein
VSKIVVDYLPPDPKEMLALYKELIKETGGAWGASAANHLKQIYEAYGSCLEAIATGLNITEKFKNQILIDGEGIVKGYILQKQPFNDPLDGIKWLIEQGVTYNIKDNDNKIRKWSSFSLQSLLDDEVQSSLFINPEILTKAQKLIEATYLLAGTHTVIYANEMFVKNLKIEGIYRDDMNADELINSLNEALEKMSQEKNAVSFIMINKSEIRLFPRTTAIESTKILLFTFN